MKTRSIQPLSSAESFKDFDYNPDRLLNSLQELLNLKNDAELSRALGITPPVISKIRHRKLLVGAFLLIRMHETTQLSIRELRTLMGDQREKFSMNYRPVERRSNVLA